MICAAVAASIGALELSGLHARIDALLRWIPAAQSMTTATALGLVLGGVALALVGTKLRRAAALPAALAALLGVVALLRYASGDGSTLESWLFSGEPDGPNLFGASSETSAAVAMILVGGALATLALARLRGFLALHLSMAGAVVTGLAATALVGTLGDQQRFHAWGSLAWMALPAALAFGLLGVGVIAAVRRAADRRVELAGAAALPGGALVLGAWLAVWFVLSRAEVAHVEREAELHAVLLAEGLKAGMRERTSAYSGSRLPEVGLVLGLVSAVLLSVTVQLARSAGRRRAESADANARLELEIAERRRAQEELARSNEELEQFASVASHDMQEPLRAVSGYLELLVEHSGTKLDAEGREYVAIASEAAERMRTLIRDLLAYARVGRSGREPSPVELDSVVQLALANLRRAIEESHATVEVEPLPVVLGDAALLTQALQNLLSNALKYHDEKPPRVRVFARPAGERWCVSVADEGIGIDPRHFERIVKPFQRLHPRDRYGGSGVGLAVVERVVRMHGGTLEIASAPGAGATFSITLPRGHAAETLAKTRE